MLTEYATTQTPFFAHSSCKYFDSIRPSATWRVGGGWGARSRCAGREQIEPWIPKTHRRELNVPDQAREQVSDSEMDQWVPPRERGVA